jgi:hypothetical protein
MIDLNKSSGPERAFPSTFRSLNDDEQLVRYGMELRDYFAAKALQGLLTSADCFWPGAAPLAYQYADAMLEARK